MKVILVTGGAGFIGSHLSRYLLQQGNIVLGIDCFTDYYDIKIKKRRVQELQTSFPETFTFYELNLNEKEKVTEIFLTKKPEIVIHLAAQAGVGYCEQNPDEAKRNNIQATEVLLSIVDREDIPITHFLFASSSSIYGCHQRPWSEELEPQPEGIYGNSKKLGEEMLKQRIGKKYSITSMRFFTVYGQGGRPDMAIQKFTELIHKGEIVPIYGDGSAVRDYTYVDDIVQGITKAIENPRLYEAYNFGKGSDNPCSVIEVVRALELALNKKANINFQEIRAGDVPATQANISKAQRLLGYNPGYSLQDGIRLSVPYFLQHFPKYPVLILKNNNDDSIRSIVSQTSLPSLVILGREASAESVELLKKSNIPFVHYSFESFNNNNCYWKKAFELVENSFAEHSDFTSSTVFISFIDGNVPNDSSFIERFIEPISKSGAEVVQLIGNDHVDFIRFDVLKQFIRNVDDNQSVLEQFGAFSQNSENNIRHANVTL